MSPLAALTLALYLGGEPAARDDRLTLEVGEQRVVKAPCHLARLAVDATPPTLQRIAVGDSSTVDVKTIGHDQILFIGYAEGVTTVLAWCSNGRRISYLIKVVTARLRPRPESEVKVKTSEARATVIDETGARDTTVTIVEIPEDLHDVSEVTTADGTVSFVGYDSAGRRVTVSAVAVPYQPRRKPRADAGVADAGVRRDGG